MQSINLTSKSPFTPVWRSIAVMAFSALSFLFSAEITAEDKQKTSPSKSESSLELTERQLAIGPIAASSAMGDMTSLNHALNMGLDAGLSVSDIKEILTQLYAYAGFPRSLNALKEFMAVLEERKSQGIEDNPGKDNSASIPTGEALLNAGTKNQTELTGRTISGPLFEFAPAIDEYLKTHLFGDIFTRNNLSWQDRELATVAMLSAMDGVESQLSSHLRISQNAGLTDQQLADYADTLSQFSARTPHRLNPGSNLNQAMSAE